MYSGTTFRDKSGKFIGVHQRIDSLARRDLEEFLPEGNDFPKIKDILHFEGNNGPDGIKRKSPSVDEPWHFIDPTDSSDKEIIEIILGNFNNLVKALKEKNYVRASFEASWLAHGITDGLTPAHHYPLAEKIEELWGKPKDERLSIIDKNVIIGETKKDTLKKNWTYWGAKGVFTTHVLFELGVASTMRYVRFSDIKPDGNWLIEQNKKSLEDVFLDAVMEVFEMNMYQEFWQKGWTKKLAKDTKDVLIPKIVNVVMYFWLKAWEEAHEN